MKTFICVIVTLMYSVSAHAADVYLFSMKAQKTGEKTAWIGIRTDSKNQLESVLFREHGKQEPEAFSVSDASRSSVTMVRKWFVNIVTFKISGLKSTSMTIDFKYLYSHAGLSFNYRSKPIQIVLNPTTDQYEAIDVTANRVISQIYATNHYEKGDVNGIDEIKAW